MGLTQSETSRIGRELLATWEHRGDSPLVGTRRRSFTQSQLAVVHGLVAHTHYMAGPALDLLDAGRVLAALPLVRSCYESAITAQWAAQSRDGYTAFMNEDIRQRRNHVRAMSEAASTVFREAASTIHGADFEDFPTTASARTFDKVCDDLDPGGHDAYVTYRMQSHLTHPSVIVVDQYLDALDVEPGLALRLSPKEPSPAPWTALVVSSLIWAGRAAEYLDKHHTRRKQLLNAARALGVAPHLHLSETAVVREAAPNPLRARNRSAKAS